MESKKIIETLVRIANNQQKIIHKLAQALPPDALPTSGTTYTPDAGAPPAAAPPPTSIKPVDTTKNDARVIINSLPPAIKNHLVDLQVHDGQVKVKWKSPVSDAVFNTVTKTVQNLQQQNALPGKNYKVTEAS
jgi:hypothetical protein